MGLAFTRQGFQLSRLWQNSSTHFDQSFKYQSKIHFTICGLNYCKCKFLPLYQFKWYLPSVGELTCFSLSSLIFLLRDFRLCSGDHSKAVIGGNFLGIVLNGCRFFRSQSSKGAPTNATMKYCIAIAKLKYLIRWNITLFITLATVLTFSSY